MRGRLGGRGGPSHPQGCLPGAGLLLLVEGRLSPSQCWWADEDCQQEQFSLDFVSMITNLRSLNGLPEALSESRKICCFHAAVEDDDQPVSSYMIPIGGASADILAEFRQCRWGCILKNIPSCCSIWVSAAGNSTGSRERNSPR